MRNFAGLPCTRSLSLPEPWPITSCIAVSMSSASSPCVFARCGFFGRRRELVDRAAGRRAERVAAAEQQKVLGAVLRVNLLLVRQVDADRVDVEVAGLDQHLDGLDDRRREVALLVLRVPRRLLLEVGGVLREVDHHGGHRLVGDRDEALRRALGAARIAVDLDEAVGEIHVASLRTQSPPNCSQSFGSPVW